MPSAAATLDNALRQNVLTAARRFKAGWAELGRLLVQVRDSGAFSEWGYPNFDAYCAEELHVRKQTAQKLVRSYSFLARREPDLGKTPRAPEDSPAMRAPAFEVVEVLADADARGQLSEDEYHRIRESIWNPDRPASDLKRELMERYPRPAPAEPSDRTVLRRLSTAAQRLAAELKATRRVPRAVVERAAALAEDVEALVAAASEG